LTLLPEWLSDSQEAVRWLHCTRTAFFFYKFYGLICLLHLSLIIFVIHAYCNPKLMCLLLINNAMLKHYITEFSSIAVVTGMYVSTTFLWRLSIRTSQMDVDK
jgi:hypothetical protein